MPQLTRTEKEKLNKQLKLKQGKKKRKTRAGKSAVSKKEKMRREKGKNYFHDFMSFCCPNNSFLNDTH